MGKVVNIQSFQPHVSGEAKCVGCGYRWVAVAPVGVTELECSECGTMKGVFIHIVVPKCLLQCPCGNELYYVVPEGNLCVNCGSIVLNGNAWD